MKINIKQRFTTARRLLTTVFTIAVLAIPSLVPATTHAAANNTEGTTITNNALSTVGSATDISQIKTAMNSFLGQYGLTFTDTCTQPGYCTGGDLTNDDLSVEKPFATDFINAFSVINTGLVAATQLQSIGFVTDLSGAIGGAAGLNFTSSILYNMPNLVYGGNGEYDSVFYHEFGHSVGYLIQNDETLRNQWLSYNVPGLPLLDPSAQNYSWFMYDNDAINNFCPDTEASQYCRSQSVPYGFVSVYSHNTLQEDYAETFAAMFSHYDEQNPWYPDISYGDLVDWIPNDPYLGSKVEMMRNVIKTADPTTDENVYGYAGIPINTDIPQPQEPEEPEEPEDDTIIIHDGETRSIDSTVNDVIVEGGGTLKGTGTIRNLTVHTSGNAQPGHSPGCLTITGDYTLHGIFQAELGGTTPCTDYDQFITSGAVNLTGSTLDAAAYHGYDFKVGQTFTILKNNATSPIVGTFNDLAEGAQFRIGDYMVRITYQGGDGNDVVLKVTSRIPTAPNTGFMLLKNNPLLTVLTLFTAAAAILVLNKKLRGSVRA